MSFEPALILVSGSGRQSVEAPPLSFATKTKELGFTSCSGVILSPSNGPDGVDDLVLVPASALRPWLPPGTPWLSSAHSLAPPPLGPDVAICALNCSGALIGGARFCTPIATLRVTSASQAAARLLQGLNRDHHYTTSQNWTFSWSLGGLQLTPAEQGAFVLCLAHPPGAPNASASPPSSTFVPLPAAKSSTPSGSVSWVTAAAAALGHNVSPANGLSTDHPAALQPHAGRTGADLLVSLARSLSMLPSAPQATCRAQHGVDSIRACADDNTTLQNTAAPASAPTPPAAAPNRPQAARPGTQVSVLGSPFGCLAPYHFMNAQVNGIISCVFPSPAPAAAAASQLPQPRPHPQPQPHLTAAAGGDDAAGHGGCCGHDGSSADGAAAALFALDAHVFPGMEGAPVFPLRQPVLPHLSSCAPASGRLVAPMAAGSQSAQQCPCASPAAVAAEVRPLAVLCTPLCRRTDGVQIALAVPWVAVQRALADLLGSLLPPRPAAVGQAGHAGGLRETSAPKEFGAGKGGAGAAQQLALQPAAAADAAAGTATACRAITVASPRVPVLHASRPSCPVTKAGTSAGSRAAAGPTGGDTVTGGGAGPPPPHALESVVLLRCDGSWATGVVVQGRAGLLVTTAHLFQRQLAAGSRDMSHGPGDRSTGPGPAWARAVPRAGAAGGGRIGAGSHADDQRSGVGSASAAGAHLVSNQEIWGNIVCWARVPQAAAGLGCGGGPGQGRAAAGGQGGWRWVRGRLIYVWGNHLDLAVLQLQLGGEAGGEGLRGGQAGRVLDHRGWGAIGGSSCGGGGGGSEQRAVPSAVLPAVQQTARAVGVAACCGAVTAAPPANHGSGCAAPAKAGAVTGCSASDRSGDSAAAAGGDLAAGARARYAGAATGPVQGLPHHAAAPLALRSHPAAAGAAASTLPGSSGGVYEAGTPVWAVGHSLVEPAAGWPPLVSYGCVARVLRRPSSGHPTMVVATTTTHAGGSGGALLDSAGRLVGLVTSNARHAGGTTLPNLAFCIAAEELEPVLRWAAAYGDNSDRGDGGGGGRSEGDTMASAMAAAAPGSAAGVVPGSPQSGVSALAALDVADEEAARIWRLQVPTQGGPLGPPACPGPAPGQEAASNNNNNGPAAAPSETAAGCDHRGDGVEAGVAPGGVHCRM